jgi:hypothetical protein
MMHGSINLDKLSKVIEQILSERDENVDIEFKFIPIEDYKKSLVAESKDKTA